MKSLSFIASVMLAGSAYAQGTAAVFTPTQSDTRVPTYINATVVRVDNRTHTVRFRSTSGEVSLSVDRAAVLEPDGSGRRTLVGGGDVKGALAFSVDGSRLAYWSQASTAGPWDLVVVDADGSNPVTVASGILEPTGVAPSWSPDGATIAFSARTASAEGSSCPGHGSQNGDFCSSRIFLAPADG